MVEPQPTKIPIWNTSGTNRTEPLSTEKTSGWTINDQPPSSYFNWLQYFTGAWLTWLNERVTKGTNEIDLVVSALQPDTAGVGGDLTLSSGAANGANQGGAVTISSPDSTTGATGDVTLKAGDVGSPGVGRGGDLNLNAGRGWTGRGGDTYLSAGNGGGTGNRDGGEVFISAGVGIGSGAGGRIRMVSGGAGVGGNAGDIEIIGNTGVLSGSDVRITAGDSPATPGNIVLTAGDATSSGSGGDVTLNGGDGDGAAGGAISLNAGGSDAAGGNVSISAGTSTGAAGGNVSITAGNSDINFEGGDVNITGGSTENSNGGDVNLLGGSVVGTDRQAGFVTISSGSSTGAGAGKVGILLAEAGTSGTGVRAPVEYIDCNGATTAKRVKINRHVLVQNIGDTTRGDMRIVGNTTVPTTPDHGDVWYDQQAKQLKVFGTSRHASMNQLIWNASEQEYFGITPAGPLTLGQDYVLQQQNYAGGGIQAAAFKADLLANAMREGAVLRVRCMFLLETDGTPPGTRLTPKIEIMLGSVGSGPPYNGGSGDYLFTHPFQGSNQVWDRCSIECEGRYWEASGGTDYLDVTGKALFLDQTAGQTINLDYPFWLHSSINTDTFSPTVGLSVFPRVDMSGLDAAWKVTCHQFVVELL